MTELKELFGREAGSIVAPGHKHKINQGGAAIIMMNSHNRRPHLFSQPTKNKNIVVAACMSMEVGKEMVLLVSFYITPNTDERSRQEREGNLNDLQVALENLNRSFKDVGIVLAGDYNRIGIDRVGSIANICGLKLVFHCSATYDKGNHLDQIYTNLPFTVQEMVPLEGLKSTTDHNALIVRVNANGRGIELADTKLS